MAGENGISFDELLRELERLPYPQFRRAVEHYAHSYGLDVEREWNSVVYQDFQQRLEAIGVNTACPYCGSAVIQRYGDRNSIKRYRCADCGRTFTRFSGTMLERSRWPWPVWVKVLEMTLNDFSLRDMQHVLIQDMGCDGINLKTIHSWRLKFVHAMAKMEQPVLSGVVQIDETFLRECQKGRHLELISYIPGVEREPRYGYQPSKLGVMGPEFATIITAIDGRGYCVCKVAALGRVVADNIIDLFEHHLSDLAFLCTDANGVYSSYCDLYSIPHYVRPSNYHTLIEKAGYGAAAPGQSAEAVPTNNKRVLEQLYREGVIDKIEHREDLNFQEFSKLKQNYGLSLARVNELHKDLKLVLEKQMTNVASKYLIDYVGFFTYRRNWRVANGHYPSSSRDAEAIFIDLLRRKVNYTIPAQKKTALDLPKPSGRYVQILKERTEAARQITKNSYFKFDEEDNVISFDSRKILLDAPKSKLLAVAKQYKIKGYTKMGIWVLAAEIAKLPDIDEIIVGLITADRSYMISEEDVKYIHSLKYKQRQSD